MNRQLPARPSLAQLENEVEELRRGAVSPGDAQLMLAREYGFASWSKLKHHVEGMEELENRVERLREEFARGDIETKKRLLKPAHDQRRFENYDPSAGSISDRDARLLIANEEGYALWNKYESFLHLDPDVRDVIAAVQIGDLERLKEVLQANPSAANPSWVPGFAAPRPAPNDSIPLFCVSQAVFDGLNQRGNGYEITQALIDAGADVDTEGGHPLTAAVSFGALRVAEALIDNGAKVDGVDGDGVPMAYAMHFTFREIAELLARRGAKLDVRFAAGLGRLDIVKSFFADKGSLKPGSGALADPFGLERKQKGQSVFWCERTPANILSQALYYACIHNELQVAEFLLSQGADINAIVPGLDIQATILHRVAALGVIEPRTRVLNFLLEHGASLTVRDLAFHGSPVGWAYYCNRRDIFDLLIDQAGIHDLVRFDRIDRLRAVLEENPQLARSCDARGLTPLHYLHGHLKHAQEIVDVLIAHGADVNARDSAGQSVLETVNRMGTPEMVEHLRSLGATLETTGRS